MTLESTLTRMMDRLDRLERSRERGAFEVPRASVRRLAYVAPGTIWNATAIGAATTDFMANQNFTVGGGTSSLLMFSLRGAMLIFNATVSAGYSVRLLIDGATVLSICSDLQIVSNVFQNPIRPGMGVLTGLSAGTHTVKAQLITNSAGNTAYLRAPGATEFLELDVWEEW